MLSSSARAMRRRRELVERTTAPAGGSRNVDGEGREPDVPPVRLDPPAGAERAIDWTQPERWETTAPELRTWLRRYAGQSTYRLEQATDELEAAVESGEGFADRDVLEYAYLCLRTDKRREPDMTDNGRRHWRIKDICEQYDVSRVTLDNWRNAGGEDPFPAPIIDSPPVWDMAEVEAWRVRQLEAVRARKERALEIASTGDLAGAASAAGVSTRTIRRWIAAREEGE